MASLAMVVLTPQGIEVKARRRLADAAAFDGMLEELMSLMQQHTTEEKGPFISDLDLSQNNLTLEQFEAIFAQLGAHNARVHRFRMFGCPTLNDEVIKVLSDYLRPLTPQTAPTEMHLSDNAITTEGWKYLMSVIEEHELYPALSPHTGRPAPLYLRLENNYVNEDVIQESVDAGVVRPWQKMPTGGRPPGADGGIKVNLVVMKLGQFQQKQGDPPAPEDCPPPKIVYDKYSDLWKPPGSKSSWGGSNGDGGMIRPYPARSFGSSTWQQRAPVAAAPALTEGAVWRKPTMVPPAVRAQGNGGCKGGSFNTFGGKGGAKGGGNGWAKSGGGGGGGSPWQPRVAAGGYGGDRSRSPTGRGGGSPVQPPMPPPKTSDMLHPWEEHWSDEFQIPYYWNSETGEAAWERPA